MVYLVDQWESIYDPNSKFFILNLPQVDLLKGLEWSIFQKVQAKVQFLQKPSLSWWPDSCEDFVLNRLLDSIYSHLSQKLKFLFLCFWDDISIWNGINWLNCVKSQYGFVHPNPWIQILKERDEFNSFRYFLN